MQRVQINQASHRSAKVTATVSPTQDLAPDYGWCRHCLTLDSLHWVNGSSHLLHGMAVMNCSLPWLHICMFLLSTPVWPGGYGLLPTMATPLCVPLVHSSMADSLSPQALESNASPNCSPACVPLRLPSEGTEGHVAFSKGQHVRKVHFPLN